MTDYVVAELRRLVSQRAGDVCEYCLIGGEDSFFNHQIEHIISLKHGGESESDNLALACVFCNSNKGSDIASLAQNSQDLVRLYNPRTDRWSEHFQIDGSTIKPLSDIGEATVRILKMNSDERLLERKVLIDRGKYPNENAVRLITHL